MKQTMLIADGDAELCDHYRNFATKHGYEVETPWMVCMVLGSCAR